MSIPTIHCDLSTATRGNECINEIILVAEGRFLVVDLEILAIEKPSLDNQHMHFSP